MCFQRVCIDPWHPYFFDGTKMVQIVGEGFDWPAPSEYITHLPKKDENGDYITSFESYSIRVVDTQKKYSRIWEKEPLGGNFESFSQIWENLIIKITEQMGCATNYREEFFDMSGKKIMDPTALLPTYPREIIIGSLHLISDWKRSGESNMFSIKFSSVESPKDLGTTSLHSDYRSFIREKIMEDSSIGLFATYVLRFEEIPNVLFFYRNNLGSSEAIINIPMESQDIGYSGNVMSESKTKEMLMLYTGSGEIERKIWRSIRREKNEDDYIWLTYESFSTDLMPIFRVIKWEGDRYFLFPAHGYEWFTSAELCKPLVYIYDIFSRKNRLSIWFPQWGNFTKIIPDFSGKQSWDFHSDSQGVIMVENKTQPFEYLYYSARVPDYLYNTWWWQVYGRDIHAFFDEKLDFIGMTSWEKNEFINYWIPEFHPDVLYFVSFKFDTAIDHYVTLDFSQKPLRQMRILLEAYPVDRVNNSFLWPHVGTKLDALLLKHFDRSHIFDVFEWGGTVQTEKYNILTIH